MSILRIWPISMAMILVFSFGCQCLSGQENDKDQTPQVEGTTVISFVEMNYPHLARMARIQGPVVVRLTLDGAGKVVSPEAITGHPLLVREVLRNARKWRFRSYRSKTAVVVYEFRFANGTCGDSRSQIFIFQPPNTASVVACPETVQPSSK